MNIWIKLSRVGKGRCEGSIALEAALVMPVLIIVVLPFLFILQMTIVSATLEDGLDQCIKNISVESYVLKLLSVLPEEDDEGPDQDESKWSELEKLLSLYTDGISSDDAQNKIEVWGYNLAGELILKEMMRQWCEDENINLACVQNGFDGISFSGSRFFYTDQGHSNLIKGSMKIKWNSYFSFWSAKDTKIERVYHAFVGEEDSAYFAGEDSDFDSETVYQIGSGSHYHSFDCYLIKKDIYSISLSEAKASGKNPCLRCKPTSGSFYCTKGGESYHSKDCSYLYPNLTKLNLSDAIEKGMTGCALCQGGENYFGN